MLRWVSQRYAIVYWSVAICGGGGVGRLSSCVVHGFWWP